MSELSIITTTPLTLFENFEKVEAKSASRSFLLYLLF